MNVSTTGLLSLNYYYCANQALSCTTNNGNLLSETIGATKYSFALTQNFGYDGLNRLLTAIEPTPANPAVAGWSQNQGYDQYGNRWMAANPGLPPVTTSVPTTQAGVCDQQPVVGGRCDVGSCFGSRWPACDLLLAECLLEVRPQGLSDRSHGLSLF